MNLLHFKNTPIAYSDTGKGTAVVLLHGFLENRSMWETYIPELTKKYRVITIDLLGHGGSGCLGYIHTMEDNADVVYEVLSTLKIKKAILAGHSMGGYVALAFAELYPEKIKGLVLINSTSKPDNEERRQNRDRAIKAVKQSYTNFVSLSIANLFSEDNRDKLKEEIEKVKVQALQTPLQGIIASLEGMKVRKDREVLLHNGPYPKMLVLGKKDPILNYEENVEQVKGTSVTLITLPDGHMSPIENRDELLKVILDF